MKWYKVSETIAKKANFLLIDLSYYPAFLEVKKKTGKLWSFASYVDHKNNLVSEFMNEEEKNNKDDFGYRFFLNNQNFTKYFSAVQGIIKSVNIYKKTIDRTNFDNISINTIIRLFKRGVPLYHKALGLFLISQPEFTEKIEIFIRDRLKDFVPKRNINDVLIGLTLSPQESCLEKERYDWLKNIVIPAITRYQSLPQLKKDPVVLKGIEKHEEKYKYYSASTEFGLWDRKHYLKLLKDDFSKGRNKLKQELLNIKNKKKINQRKKQEIIKRYKINSDLVEKTEFIAKLGVLRMNLRVLGWQFFNYLFPKLTDISSKILKLPKEEVGNLSYVDFVKLLQGSLTLNTNFKERKDKNVLVLITSQNGYQVFCGQSADKKYNSEIIEKINKVKEFKGMVVNNKGIVRGKVFLFKWNSKDFNKRIYKFPKDYILVVGQTRPLLMPAIRKAKMIITDEGGLLCHAAIVSRELDIPCIVGTKIATKVLKDGDLVEVDAEKGIVKILKRKK